MITMIGQLYRAVRTEFRLRSDPVGYAVSIGVEVGRGCQLEGIDKKTFGSEPYLIRLGSRVRLSSDVRFITHDGGAHVFREEHPNLDVFGRIVVGDNTFIGMRAMILPGVEIGSNCVIGAGSVVTRSVPSGMVAAGVPAKVIRPTREYWEKSVQPKACYIRGDTPTKKRQILEQAFHGNATPGARASAECLVGLPSAPRRREAPPPVLVQ